MICSKCKKGEHSYCKKKHELGSRCDCRECFEDYLKTLRIDNVKITHNGRCLSVDIGCFHTHLDVRDLFQCPSWNDRLDNRKETLEKIKSDS